ncbi:hypothetical protein C922_03879 [Plasmodium inui San Antonio 1]|uniref:CS domain-containing protein n=1 Tax=Plasmodium inui San Antonio 1 TaxID=1237626 RepID=W7A2R8_9APIC|nr:hypothetical protein C922_03879 [Plasmodium inui San Antonio 1]EUD65633.1 hypothetical protein C922_03879 [Plasmodium inui San Antonio 1]
MLFFRFFVVFTLTWLNVVLSKLNFQNEQIAASFFEANSDYRVTKEDVVDGIEKCWFNVTNYLINQSIKQENDFSSDVKTAVNSMKLKLDQLVTLSYSIKKIDTVNASFQWAQSPEDIFLNIKFSHRWSSPGALKVKDEEVVAKKNFFSFSALSDDTNSVTKKYTVDLKLLHDIVESETKYNFASVGKVVVTLKKKEKRIWNRLLKSNEKNPNMQVWWDMKEKYHDSVQSFLKEEEKKRKQRSGNNETNDNGETSVNDEVGTIPGEQNKMEETQFDGNENEQDEGHNGGVPSNESKKDNPKNAKNEEL